MRSGRTLARGVPWGLAAASLLSATAAAGAAPSGRTSALAWSRLPGAESCVHARDLAAAVEQRLGRPVFVAPAGAELTVEGHVAVAPPPATYRAVLRLADGDGQVLGSRELETSDVSCRDLAGSIELAVVLMIDPDAASRARQPGPPPPGLALLGTRPATPDDRTEPEHREPPDPPAPWTFQATAGPMLSAGYLPALASGVQLRARLDPEYFPAVTVGGVLTPPVRAGTTSFMLGYGTFAVCPWTGDVGVGVLAPCVGVGSGALHVVDWDVSHPIVHPMLEVSLSRRLVGPVVAALDLGVGAPLVRPTLSYSHRFRPAPVMASAGIGIGVEAP